LTRKRPSKESVSGDDESERDEELEIAKKHKLGERTLYITVFDHKERTTRVYTRVNERDTFYTTKSAPLIDVGHSLLEVEIDAKIIKGDPVSRDHNTLDSLRNHHQSILEYIQYRLGATEVTDPYTTENSWTMKMEDTICTLQRLREENGDGWKEVIEKRNLGLYANIFLCIRQLKESEGR
jgi:hypothetical protein